MKKIKKITGSILFLAILSCCWGQQTQPYGGGEYEGDWISGLGYSGPTNNVWSIRWTAGGGYDISVTAVGIGPLMTNQRITNDEARDFFYGLLGGQGPYAGVLTISTPNYSAVDYYENVTAPALIAMGADPNWVYGYIVHDQDWWDAIMGQIMAGWDSGGGNQLLP